MASASSSEDQPNKDQPKYDPEVDGKRGFVKIIDDSPAPSPSERHRLLHVLFFLSYTKEGHELMHELSVLKDKTEQQIRDGLRRFLSKRFELPEPALTALIEAHVAADLYVRAYGSNDSPEKAAQGRIYSEKMTAVLKALHEDAMGLEFSLAW